jgi:hypothetical protein
VRGSVTIFATSILLLLRTSYSHDPTRPGRMRLQDGSGDHCRQHRDPSTALPGRPGRRTSW